MPRGVARFIPIAWFIMRRIIFGPARLTSALLLTRHFRWGRAIPRRVPFAVTAARLHETQAK